MRLVRRCACVVRRRAVVCVSMGVGGVGGGGSA